MKPSDLRDLATDYEREGTDAIFKYWAPELRGSRLVTEIGCDEEEEKSENEGSDSGDSELEQTAS